MNNFEEFENVLELLKKALEFYANKDNYKVVHPLNNVLFSYVEMDEGAQAQFAIEQVDQLFENNKKMEEDFINNVVLSIKNDEKIEDTLKIIEEYKNTGGENNNI